MQNRDANGQWPCQRCTFINSGWVCVMCGYAHYLPPVHTVELGYLLNKRNTKNNFPTKAAAAAATTTTTTTTTSTKVFESCVDKYGFKKTLLLDKIREFKADKESEALVEEPVESKFSDAGLSTNSSINISRLSKPKDILEEQKEKKQKMEKYKDKDQDKESKFCKAVSACILLSFNEQIGLYTSELYLANYLAWIKLSGFIRHYHNYKTNNEPIKQVIERCDEFFSVLETIIPTCRHSCMILAPLIKNSKQFKGFDEDDKKRCEPVNIIEINSSPLEISKQLGQTRPFDLYMFFTNYIVKLIDRWIENYSTVLQHQVHFITEALESEKKATIEGDTDTLFFRFTDVNSYSIYQVFLSPFELIAKYRHTISKILDDPRLTEHREDLILVSKQFLKMYNILSCALNKAEKI